jgi:hypothetical protein
MPYRGDVLRHSAPATFMRSGAAMGESVPTIDLKKMANGGRLRASAVNDLENMVQVV